ncbi:hypothetical protein PAMA_003074 [Pampus argenteus]
MDRHQHKLTCVLCQRSEETEITGALSTKDQITAHQNCLLFSSGIYCQNSPEFDDLFGFSVEDVMEEVKRGGKLTCFKCKKKGATAGCENSRCKRSYHYPCAVREGAQPVEDADEGKYQLYCLPHYEKMQNEKNNGFTNGHDSPLTNLQTSKKTSETASSKVHCLVCEKTEGNISSDSLSNNIIMLYCDKHAPLSHQRPVHAAGPSVSSSDSNSAGSTSRKRKLSFSDIQEETPSKQKLKRRNRISSDESSNSVENEPNTEMAMFAPIESDLDESANSVPEHEDADSESLLFPVKFCVDSCATLSTQRESPAHSSVLLVNAMIHKEDEGFSPEQNPGSSPEYVHTPGQHSAAVEQRAPSAPPLCPRSMTACITHSSVCTSSVISPAPPEPTNVSLLSSPSCPATAPSDPEPSIDSTSFWKSCNVAGCTEAIFTDFINKMNDISNRIQSDQASQEEYDLALNVMAASGKLAELVAKQQKEIEKKQMELEKAAAAMKKVASALRR